MVRLLQRIIKRKGRVRRYIRRIYGNKGFDKKGRIKFKYLYKAKKRAKRMGNFSLVQAINLAIRLKKMRK